MDCWGFDSRLRLCEDVHCPCCVCCAKPWPRVGLVKAATCTCKFLGSTLHCRHILSRSRKSHYCYHSISNISSNKSVGELTNYSLTKSGARVRMLQLSQRVSITPGLVVSISDYLPRGPGFDSRLYPRNFCWSRPIGSGTWSIQRGAQNCIGLPADMYY